MFLFNFTGLEKTNREDGENYLKHFFELSFLTFCCPQPVTWLGSARFGSVLVLLMSGVQLQLSSVAAQQRTHARTLMLYLFYPGFVDQNHSWCVKQMLFLFNSLVSSSPNAHMLKYLSCGT